ncbi:MAG: hypothetical protein IPP90_18285 [Gemmatimonadaceae bacterium]|nr:hypothetical protein [Gemmatimonadaceae bacterium]
MRYLGLLVLSPLMIAGTWFAGWIAVPVLAAAYALTLRDARVTREAGAAAMLAWLVLLFRLKLQQPSFATLLDQLGQIFPVPGVAVAALALVLAVVLAASAARLVIGIVGVRDPVVPAA